MPVTTSAVVCTRVRATSLVRLRAEANHALLSSRRYVRLESRIGIGRQHVQGRIIGMLILFVDRLIESFWMVCGTCPTGVISNVRNAQQVACPIGNQYLCRMSICMPINMSKCSCVRQMNVGSYVCVAVLWLHI